VNPPLTSAPPVASTQPRPDLLPALGWLLGAFGLGSYVVWLAGVGPGSPAMGWDFRAYYAATHALVTGGNLYDLGLPNTPFYLYPPLLAFLLLPVGLAFPLSSAGTIWLIGQHLCLLLLGIGVLAVTWVPGGGWPLSLRAGLLLFLWGTGIPLRDEIYLGQVNSGVWLLLLAGLVLAQPWRPDVERGGGPRLLITALVLGLAISIKVQPVVLLPYFVLRRRPRIVIATTGAFLLFQIVTIPFTPSTLDYWFHLFPDLLGRAQGYVDNQSINGLAARWLLPGVPDLPTLGNDPAAWRLVNLGGNLLVWGAVLGVFAVPILIAARPGRVRLSLPTPAHWRLYMLLEIALLLLTVNITSYLTWPHHLIWWVLPALALIGWWVLRGHTPALGVLALGLIALIFSRSPTDWLHLVDPRAAPQGAILLSGMHLYALGLLWILLAGTLLRAATVRVKART
jgi:alpha-1,2-mannosyltransferase